MPQSTPKRRWTEDTSTAFLLALQLTGQVGRATAAIGRVKFVVYDVRKRDPGFAAKWDAIIAEQAAERRLARSDARARQRAAAKTALVPDAGDPDDRDASGNRARWSGLTQVKRRAFLRALAESGGVDAACAAVGVSDTAIYRLRGADADFAAAWDRALATSAPLLEQVVWERAVEGWEEPVFAGGKQVGTRRRFSESLLRQLVVKRERAVALADDPKALIARAEEAARAAGGRFYTLATEEESNALLRTKLDRLRWRLEREELRAAEEAGLFAGVSRGAILAAPADEKGFILPADRRGEGRISAS